VKKIGAAAKSRKGKKDRLEGRMYKPDPKAGGCGGGKQAVRNKETSNTRARAYQDDGKKKEGTVDVQHEAKKGKRKKIDGKGVRMRVNVLKEEGPPFESSNENRDWRMLALLSKKKKKMDTPIRLKATKNWERDLRGDS